MASKFFSLFRSGSKKAGGASVSVRPHRTKPVRVEFRTTEEVKLQILALVEMYGKRLGCQVSMGQALEMAVKEALQRADDSVADS